MVDKKSGQETGLAPAQEEDRAPTFGEAAAVWGKIGLLSFGGPVGQIALMHRMLVDERRWLSEQQFLAALNFCMLLPGPEAMQLATYAGWRLHGIAGGLVAGLLFVIPGALVMLALSMAYAAFGAVPVVEAVFVGIKAAVLAIVIEALIKVSRRAIKGWVDYAIAAASFVGIFFFNLPFPLIVLTAALIGFYRGALLVGEANPVAQPAGSDWKGSLASTFATVVTWLFIWIAPLAAIAFAYGPSHVFSQLGLFFSKLAVVTFGGAYAVLAYMAQEVVEHYGWLTPGEMLDGLGLAETTPGPLIMVTQFVGYLAAERNGGGVAMIDGIIGAVVTTWATFAPCFLWIFAGAPYIERLHNAPRLRAALASVTAAVVGVILNLSVWFGLHVLFGRFTTWELGGARVEIPELASVNIPALALSCLAAVLIFALRAGVITTLGICAGTALAWYVVAPLMGM